MQRKLRIILAEPLKVSWKYKEQKVAGERICDTEGQTDTVI